MAAVTARFIAHWDDDGTALGNALDLALEDSKLRRIDEIVGGINREKRRVNFFQIRAGIVVV